MYGWNKRFQDRWTKVKNDPVMAQHWKALPSEAKYQITKDKSLFSLKTLIGTFAGRQYPQFNIRQNKFIFLYTTKKPLNDFNDKYFKVGAEVKTSFSSTTELAHKTYKIIDVKRTVITGKDEGGAKETILDSTKDFATLGVTTDWVVEITSGRYIGTVLKVGATLNSHEITVGGYQTHSASYKLISPLQITLDGTFTDADKVYLYPAAETLYNPVGTIPDHNTHRAHYPDLARKIDMFWEAISQEDRGKVLSVLDMFTDLVLYDEGISLSDSDEIISVYMGAYAHALVDPLRKEEILKHPLMAKWRQRIDLMISLISNETDDFAVWIEGTYYSPNTIKSLMQNAIYIEWATGKDEFPELTKRLKQISEGCKVELMPGFKDQMYWSDTQRLYGTMAYRNMDKIATTMECLEIKTGVKDKELGYLREKIQTAAKSDQIDSPFLQRYTPFWNPYAEKVDDAYWLTKPGKIYHNSRLGFVFAFSGWNPEKDSVMFSSAWPGSGFDHNPNADNLNLWSKGERLLEWRRGYPSTDWETMHNCMTPFGEQTAFTGRGEVHFASGKNWFVQKGSRSGNLIPEQSRTTYYYRTAKGSDVVVVVDDLKIDALPTPEQLLTYRHEEKAQMEAGGLKHQINWYLPVLPQINAPNRIEWMGDAGLAEYIEGKQTVVLIPMIEGEYTATVYKNSDFAGKQVYPWIDRGADKPDAIQGYSLRIVPAQQIGVMRFVHFISSMIDTSSLEVHKTTNGVSISADGEVVVMDFNKMTIDDGEVIPVPDPVQDTLTVDVKKSIKKVILNIEK